MSAETNESTTCSTCHQQAPIEWDDAGRCADCMAAAIPPNKDHIGPGCGCGLVVYVERGYSYRPVVTRCGSTGTAGYPEFCDKCAPRYADRDWRGESIEAGENFDDEY